MGENTEYSILCPTGIKSIETTNNISVVSSTNSTITIRPLEVTGAASMAVTLNNGDYYKKHFWIGRSSVDLKITSQVNYVFMEIIPLASDFETQNISYIEWRTISSSTQGSPYMGTAINQFENMARGTTTNWSIDAQIHVQNDCGTTLLNRTIQPQADDDEPCGYRYAVNKVNEKEFAIFKIINPCEERTASQKEKVKDEDIGQAVLLDMFGNQLRAYQGNNFNVEGIKEGVYLFKIQIGNGLVTQKIIIE